MPSQRRIRHYVYTAIALFVLGLWYTSSTRSSRQNAKYMDTLVKLGEQDRIHQAVVNKLHSRLREAADTAKERVNAQMGDKFKAKIEKYQQQQQEQQQKQVVETKKEEAKVEVEGETKKEVPLQKQDDSTAKQEKQEKQEEKQDESEATYDPSTELTSILHRAPIIIFSKSYCPYSAAAKHILLSFYVLTPPAYIVELDLHEHGRELQAFLKQQTGRGTVPNILVNGKSLGGGDEVKELHELKQLAKVLRSMGGRRLGVEEK